MDLVPLGNRLVPAVRTAVAVPASDVRASAVMSNVTEIFSIASAVVVILAAIAALIAWFYHRGGTETSLKEAVQENTEATREVTAELKDFKNTTVEKLHDLDKRVTKLEVQ